LKHIPTRWLTLYKAIDRLIENFDAIKNYFSHMEESSKPQIICDFFGEICNGEKELELQKFNELLLHFCHQYMKIINETILTLQMKSISAVHLYDVMFKLLIKLKNRLEV
jgi:hypothetical protein